MPHQTLKLSGGVLTNETQALNEAGISSSNLIRLKPDPKGLTLVEKLGGWGRFYSNQVTNGPIRALWGYQDTILRKWIVYGTENMSASQLAAIECFTSPSTGLTVAASIGNYFHDITPQVQSDAIPPLFTTIANSPLIKITDPTVSGVTQYDVAYITTPVSVGGIALEGMYSLTTLSGDVYELTATNILAQPLPAVYTTMAAPIVINSGTFAAGVTTGKIVLGWTTPNYTVPLGEAVVVNGITPASWNGTYVCTASTATSVTLAVYTNSLPAYVGGGTISNYGVVPLFITTSGQSVVTCVFPEHGQSVGSTFSILNETMVCGITLYGTYTVLTAPNTYTFTFSGQNSANSSGYQFQNAMPVLGGTGNGTTVTLTFGGNNYISPAIVPTGGTATGTQITFTWTSPSYTFAFGSTIIVSGFLPVDWNGTYTVQASTAGSVTVNSSAVDAFVSAGTIDNAQFNIGAHINVAGIQPSGWNGYQTLTAVTANTVSFLNSTAGSWITGGSISDNGGDVGFIYSIGSGPIISGVGYGVGGYGVGGYGTGQITIPFAGNAVTATNWDITNYGDLTIACVVGSTPITYPDWKVIFQPIYYWDPTANQQIAQAIQSGPPVSTGVFVAMPQRQIVAWGSSFDGVVDPLLIRWSDVNNVNTWVAQVVNEAGSFRIPSGSRIVGALQIAQQALLWTDIELWAMQFTGPPYVYGFTKIGQGCGLIARHAAVSLNGVPFWMSNTQFFTLTGNGVEPIICPVWDIIFQDLDLANVDKITAAANSLFQEITWYYPVSGGSGENTNYVRFNISLGQWDFGTLGRSAWIDVSTLGQPIGADPANEYIYQHEISNDADGQAMLSTFTTGWFALSDGDWKVFVDQVWPDMKWGDYGSPQTANVQLTFNLTGYPGTTPYTYGPYTVNQGTTYISPRMRGRLMNITVSSSDLGSFWRLGAIRYRAQPDGRF